MPRHHSAPGHQWPQRCTWYSEWWQRIWKFPGRCTLASLAYCGPMPARRKWMKVHLGIKHVYGMSDITGTAIHYVAVLAFEWMLLHTSTSDLTYAFWVHLHGPVNKQYCKQKKTLISCSHNLVIETYCSPYKVILQSIQSCFPKLFSTKYNLVIL